MLTEKKRQILTFFVFAAVVLAAPFFLKGNYLLNVFVFVGIPIATIVKRGEVVISFGISIAATSVYYILFAIAQSLALRGGLPPMISLWLPNILLIGAGIVLLRKAILS